MFQNLYFDRDLCGLFYCSTVVVDDQLQLFMIKLMLMMLSIFLIIKSNVAFLSLISK